MQSVRLPIDVRSVITARALLTEALQRSGTPALGAARNETVSSAVLMLSELVTNAVRHARSRLRLEIAVRDGELYVAVTDDSPELPILGEYDQDATGGRGMQIVDALADRWGCIPGTGDKTVWFEIALP